MCRWSLLVSYKTICNEIAQSDEDVNLNCEAYVLLLLLLKKSNL